MAKKKKYYVVWQGHEPGIYDSWAQCQAQIKNYPNAKYKSFTNRAEAEAAFSDNFSSHIGAGGSSKSSKKPTLDTLDKATLAEIEWDSIAVDAACSGNPGAMEYQGVDTKTGEQIFHQKFPLGTNNIGEFLAIVHAFALMQKQHQELPIYTDSRIAIGWVKKGKLNTKLPRNRATQPLFQVINRAEKWLAENDFRTPLLKWDTERWGEIPADFGRK